MNIQAQNEELTEERMYNLEEFGFDKNIPWYDVFTSDYEECLYIREMLSNGEELRKRPKSKIIYNTFCKRW